MKKPFPIIVEEAHEYIPQQGSRNDLSQLVEKVGKRGRKRGLGLIAASQRPQDVAKSYITQCDWLLFHRLTWDTDTKVVRRVVNKETANAVENLADGEGFLQADFLPQDLVRVQVRRMQTFDAGATPGLEGFDEPELRSVSEDLVDELETISERHEKREDQIDRLEATVEQKDERIEELEERVERLTDLREMVDSTDGLGPTSGSQPAVDQSSVTLEIDGELYQSPEVIEAEVLEIQEENADLQQKLAAVREERDTLQERVRKQQANIDELRERVESLEWIDSHFTELQEATQRLVEIVGLDDENGDTADAQEALQESRERIQELEDERARLATRVEQLEEQLDEHPDEESVETAAPIVETGDPELNRILSTEIIQEEYAMVATEGDYASEQYSDHLSAVITAEEGLTPQLAADLLQLSDTTSRDVLQDLRDNGFLRSEGERPETFYLNRTRLERRIQVAERTNPM